MIIYGVKAQDKFHYIGKLSIPVEANLTNSRIVRQYHTSPELRKVFTGFETEVVEISKTNSKDWYDQKLIEVVVKYKENNPLLNAQYQLEGKRGYWSDKTRDQNTLEQLSISKYKRVCQYDINGCLVKVWNSGKEAAIQVFKDYKVVNGSAESNLYDMIANVKIDKKFAHNSFWFKEEHIIKYFNCVPKKLNLDVIRTKQKEKRSTTAKNRKPNDIKFKTKYTVVFKKVFGNTMQFDNVESCAKFLGIKENLVKRICNGGVKNPQFNLSYGEKLRQPVKAK